MLDYIIVGQGICGTFLSYYLQKAGQTVLVIDKPQPYTASKVASGVINPVTGRRIVKTWLIDDVLPFAVTAYSEIGNQLQAKLIRQCNVLDFFATPQMQEAFAKRVVEEPGLLQIASDSQSYKTLFRYHYSIGEINPCYLTDIQTLLLLWRKQLANSNALWEEMFDVTHCQITNEQVQYQNIAAKKIIFCEGTADASNPFFDKLPFAFNKGEALLAHIPDLPHTHIYKQGITIVPWNEESLFWIGSNYSWNYTDLLPSSSFRQQTEEHLKYWLKLPFTVVDHMAAERPANVERRPFAGLHPVHSSVGILNGMGTKGCSLAPYFAYQLTQHLVNQSPIEPLADIKRFSRILSR